MKINFDSTLKDFEGRPILDSDGTPWTLRKAALGCLNVPLQGDDAMSPLEKVQLGLIGVAIVKGEDITAGDADKLKARISRVLVAPVVAWAVNEAIEHGGVDGD